MKKVVVSVTNDLSTDQRVQRSIGVLQQLGYRVHFVGRQLPGSQQFSPGYKTTRFKLPFKRGFLFYASYNLRLFWFLLFRNFDLYLSNDLDTLLPNFLVSRLKRKELVYDSHEYFTGVPEIQQRPLVKKVWTGLEKWIFPKLQHIITVNESIAGLYQQEYGKKLTVVRNIASSFLPDPVLSRRELGLPGDKVIVINQGAGINVDRGMEEMLAALPLLPDDVVLLLVGKGDVIPQLKQQVKASSLADRVLFVEPKPYARMLQYTLNADVGISLDKDTNLNYRYSLPNKLFDYIKCGLPVVVSPLKELETIVKYYQIGEVSEHEPQQLAAALEQVRKNGREFYSPGLRQAAAENNWETEQQKLRDLFSSFQ